MTENDLNYWKQVLSGVVPKELITPEVVALRDQQNKMLNLMAKKNADYGNAFNLGCEDLGVFYGLARIYDKAKRVIKLTSDVANGYTKPNVVDETLYDTIQDLANYCNMLLAWTNKDEVSMPSTGGQQDDNKVYYDIYQCINNGSSLLINEKDKDVTKEIIDTYGIENLCRDNNSYVYNQNADGRYVFVTDKQQNLVIVMSKSYFEDKLKIKQEMINKGEIKLNIKD